MNNKKGQAALEFLTTYGWAILVILIMIGALVYFGVANPSKVLPNKCEVQTGFECKDFQLTETGFNVILVNKIGESIKDVTLGKDPESDAFVNTFVAASGVCTINGAASDVVGADEQFTLSCTSSPSPDALFEGLGGKGGKVKVDYVLNYTPSRQTYGKMMSGTLYGPVN